MTTSLRDSNTKQNIDESNAYDEDRSASLMMLTLKKQTTSKKEEKKRSKTMLSNADNPWVTGVPSLHE